jgi:hypothetical protein
MPITQEQIYRFSRQPFPRGIILEGATFPGIKKGNEALVKRVEDTAFKWYAKLSGQPIDNLHAYADGINQDEDLLRSLGLGSNQLPDSHFFIGSHEEGNPELFAIQPWVNGRLLKEVSLWEILNNRPLSESLANLFLIANEFNKMTGRFPDLKGSEKIWGVSDPTKIIWPFRSTNIIVSENTAVLTDARALNPKPGSIKYGASKIHQSITTFTARQILV